MIVICAWCPKWLGFRGFKRPFRNMGKTHGICKLCAMRLNKELARASKPTA